MHKGRLIRRDDLILSTLQEEHRARQAVHLLARAQRRDRPPQVQADKAIKVSALEFVSTSGEVARSPMP